MNYHHGLIVDFVEKSKNQYPDNDAYIFMGRSVSYSEFWEQINQASEALLAIGVGEDDIVGICMPNVPQALILLYAVNKIGAVANMIHPLSAEPEIRENIYRLGIKTILVLDSLFDGIKAINDISILDNIIIASVSDCLSPLMRIGYRLTEGRKVKKIRRTSKILFWCDFIKRSSELNKLSTISDRNDKTAIILYSGGTTGKTKAVCLSNANLNASAMQMRAANPSLRPTDRFLTVMPIFHGNGLVIGVHVMMLEGSCSVLIPRFTPESYAKDMVKYRCNYISGTPTLLARVMQTDILAHAELSFIKGIFSGADSLSEEVEMRLNTFLADHHCSVHVRQGYGMTEGVVASTLIPENESRTGSIGKPFEDVRMKIVRPNSEEELPNGQIGEIVFSSVTNMIGYYNDSEETNLVLKRHADGYTWIHSGDLGYRDADGFFYFAGRIKRMIVTNGYNVYPMELESIIEKHEMVDRCCIIGVPDPERIEKVKAFIVLNEGYLPDDASKNVITEYCSQNIAKYAKPREIEFIDDFPRTRIGKVDYNALKKYDGKIKSI